jgi:predicted secreted Zn-dependent protease
MFGQKLMLFLPLLLAHAVHASPKVSVETQYYEVSGSNANEIRQSINANRKTLVSGQTFDAYTVWLVRWQYHWMASGRLCQMEQVRTSVNITFMLPKWVDREDADSNLKAHWDRYYTALIKHEEGHQQTGIEAATEIQNKLQKLKASSCEKLQKKADEMGKELIKKYNLRDIEFDKNTNHGMNDGAVFP